MQVNPTLTPIPTPTPSPTPTLTPSPSPIPIPPATLTPTVPITNLQLDINALFKTLMTQELSSVDKVVLTTKLERTLDELAAGQYQISAEFEEDNGETGGIGTGTETEKTLTITIAPIDPMATPLEEEESKEDDSSGDNGDDNGSGDEPDPEPPFVIVPGPPPFG